MIESNISFGGNCLFVVFFGIVEGKQQWFFWYGFMENFCCCYDRFYIGEVGKVVYMLFQNIKVCFMIGESFGFYVGDIFCYQ